MNVQVHWRPPGRSRLTSSAWGLPSSHGRQMNSLYHSQWRSAYQSRHHWHDLRAAGLACSMNLIRFFVPHVWYMGQWMLLLTPKHRIRTSVSSEVITMALYLPDSAAWRACSRRRVSASSCDDSSSLASSQCSYPNAPGWSWNRTAHR